MVTDEKITCYMPVAFFGGRDSEREDDVWIKGERYRKLLPNDDPGLTNWASDYKPIPSNI